MFLQENQAKLFKGVVQFQPGLLQKGQGTGLGLYSTHLSLSTHELVPLRIFE
jgi:hypothetical protein